MKFIKSLVTALLFMAAITFALKNNDPVSIKYYLTEKQIELPLYLLMFFSIIFGILIGGLEGLYERVRSGSVIRKLRREMAAKEKELTSLRNLPLTESRAVTEEVNVPEGTELKEV
ncbi:MAG: LapA family protein [Deltaproteobacteria bacterium]|nr:LapA family protein [Deltaproteobacteria bacterium]